MKTDRFGGQHTTSSDAAVSAYEDAVVAVAAHQPLGDSLTKALESDPDFCAGIALKGIGTVLLAKQNDMIAGRELAKQARACLKRIHNGTPSERALVETLELSAAGRMQAAAHRIEDHLILHPRDFLAVKLGHGLRFMSGQPDKMLATTATVLPAWSKDVGGYGYLLGCHAFGLEECGHYREAESTGRQGVLLEPADAWGLHAVSHVMEMNQRTEEGAKWLETSRPLWPKCNNFGFHLAWHLGLFRLELGDHTSVLELYDKDISPTPSQDFRDMANAASMLWRLEQEGVDVGDRWEKLREIAVNQRRDATYVFGALHFLMALVASGDHLGALELVDELHASAERSTGDQAKVAARVGAELARVIVASRKDHGVALQNDLTGIAERLQCIGGSHAQRDVFLRTLLLAAADGGDRNQTESIIRLRANQRSSDQFIDLVNRRLSNASDREVRNELSEIASSTMFH
ncbi:MAG: tetratricopeptide repeat protein [Hyphomicrobiaceae bacterium]